jgi:multidrug efflux pump
MFLSDVSIKRPVFATVMNLVIILLGLIAWNQLEIREYPDIDVPMVSVSTFYPGASAKVIESQVTVPLEEELAGIEGIDFISSISRAEVSEINIRFNLGRDEDAAAADVRDRVGRTRNILPNDVDEPVVAKREADANALIWIVFYSDNYSQLEVTEIVDRQVKDRVQVLPGVAKAWFWAPRYYAMRIWLDRSRLAGFGLTPNDVEVALRQQNVEIPAGRLESGAREFTVMSESDLRTPDEFGDIVLKNADGYLVRVRDVARVELGAEENREIARFDGRPSIALGIIKQGQANPLAVADAFYEILPDILESLPEGIHGEIDVDNTIFVRASIDAVFVTIAEAFLLVLAVIFLFLGSWRATLIPLATIPISLIGAFFLIYSFGFTINVLTLLAMVVAVGLVVDDAIVMVENIYRHIEKGKARLPAALAGSKEIAFAIVAMTLTLVAVFAPVAFTPGRTGKLFTEFALTLAGAVLISGFVALTLAPMLCSKMLSRKDRAEGSFSSRANHVLERFAEGYRRLLTSALKVRFAIFVLVGVIAIGAVGLFTTLKQELSPSEDRGFLLAHYIGPEGATPDYMVRYVAELEEIFKNTEGVKDKFYSAVGRPTINQGFTYITMKPWGERENSSHDILREIAPQMMNVPGLLAFPIPPRGFGESPMKSAIEIAIQSDGTYEELNEMVSQIMLDLGDDPVIASMTTDLRLNKPELVVNINRNKAAALGVRVDEVGRTLETLLGSREVTRFKRGNKQYDVILKVEDAERATPDHLRSIYVRNDRGQMIQLSNLVDATEGVTPRELNHFNKLRAATISANVSPGYSIAEGMATLEAAVATVAGEGVSVDYKGSAREMVRSSESMIMIFLLALGFIYLFLSAQFESFVDPLIIMLTVPLAIGGALLTMYLVGGSLNVYSQIGLVALIGLITKHGILLVEFANRHQQDGHTLQEAVIESAVQRLRPILMTTGAMILGALPLALASGAGAESRQAIGWVLVGGLSFGTAFTLFVVPAFYTLLARRHEAPAAIPTGKAAPAE